MSKGWHRYGKRFLIFAVILLFICSGSRAFAAEMPNLDREGSISMTMRDPDTLAVISGGDMTLYRVADIKKKNAEDFSFALTADFAGSGEKLYTLDAALAQHLADYAQAEEVKGVTQNIGGDGRVYFGGLKPGLFLLVQHTAAPGYYKVKPFLVTVPLRNEETGAYIYDVNAEPKMEVEKPGTTPGNPDDPDNPDNPDEPDPPGPTDPDNPNNPEDPENPNNPGDKTPGGGDSETGFGPLTGDTARLGLWITVLALAGMGICAVYRPGRKLEQIEPREKQ